MQRIWLHVYTPDTVGLYQIFIHALFFCTTDLNKVKKKLFGQGNNKTSNTP